MKAMNKVYSRELSADTSTIIIPAITLPSFLISLIVATWHGSPADNWHLWLVTIVSPLAGYAAWQYTKHDKLERGNLIFIGTNCLLLTLVLYKEWQPGSFLPYLLALFIVILGMGQHPSSALKLWAVTTALYLGATGLKAYGVIPFWSYLLAIWPPILVNFLIALICYVSTYEWHFAVESVSELHRKARARRDELFTLQQEVQHHNAVLQSLNEKLEQARATAVHERDIRTRFMTMVSHELRMPLNSIVNFAHILAQGARGPLNPEQVDYLNRVEQSGWHLLSILNDLLDIAQFQSGEFKLQQDVVDLHELCEEAMGSIQGLLMGKSVALERLYPQQWPKVWADRMRLKQALINLLGNAVKYTDEGAICLKVAQDDEWVYLHVIDTGMGIAPIHQEIIFAEFRQVDENVARQRVGTGLGLPITRHLIERHGGTVTVQSELGKGSMFTVKLPILSETAVLPMLPLPNGKL